MAYHASFGKQFLKINFAQRHRLKYLQRRSNFFCLVIVSNVRAVHELRQLVDEVSRVLLEIGKRLEKNFPFRSTVFSMQTAGKNARAKVF